MNRSRWNILPPAPENLVKVSPFPPLLTQLLYNRGLREPSLFEPFISGDSRLSYDPFLLPDMDRAAARIYQALLKGEAIAVYGDFDTDGMTSTAVLVRGLAALGAKAIPYIPHRLTEGYGLRTAALENLYQLGVSLVITADCGISGVPEVKKARELGMDVIITDHHTVPDEAPPAVAIVNPKRVDSAYPFAELAGVGVAFKLLEALSDGVGGKEWLKGLLDLVAMGTVADMVPLLGENRYLVKQGLQLINESPRLGVREMLAVAELQAGSIGAENISWILAPRLNAAGRLAHAMTGYKLLMTESEPEARELAIWLKQKNEERQELTSTAYTRAREDVQARGLLPLLLVSDADYHIGVAGLVASKLAEEFYRPAVVVQMDGKLCKGSCRSIAEFDITRALMQCSDLLTHFGGHARAAGFTMPACNLEKLEQRLLELAAEKLDGLDLRPSIDIDAEVSLNAFRGDTFKTIEKLSPFGFGNPSPAFLTRGVEVLDCRTMGNGGQHLRLKLKQGGVVWDGVCFDSGCYMSEMRSPIDMVYNLEIDRWGGRERFRLNVLDFGRGKGSLQSYPLGSGSV
ncbi:MAG: single-stranded-DNA-specific exonuclease RecJ [Chloroflexi bacterium]|nr:single-stranded-DNA-specific exonuclease RecJ [Chloroflexota bacterium]